MRRPVAHDFRTTPSPGGGIFLCALGFERRCLHAAEIFASSCKHKLAIAFEDRRVLSFEDNRAWMEVQGFEFCSPQQAAIEKCLEAAIGRYGESEAVSLIVDISSMARPMVAILVSFLSRRATRPLTVDFLYSPARFKAPGKQVPPQTYSGPVTAEYAGWTLDPSLPLAAIIGTGYEYGRALGILEYLEPAVAWIFNPKGVSAQYDDALRSVNRDLYGLIPEAQISSYNVGETLECFERIESIVYGLKDQSRVLLCPFGPKIFALICLLVAEIHRPATTVWRVSGGQSERAFDHEAAGEIYRLPVTFAEPS